MIWTSKGGAQHLFTGQNNQHIAGILVAFDAKIQLVFSSDEIEGFNMKYPTPLFTNPIFCYLEKSNCYLEEILN